MKSLIKIVKRLNFWGESALKRIQISCVVNVSLRGVANAEAIHYTQHTNSYLKTHFVRSGLPRGFFKTARNDGLFAFFAEFAFSNAEFLEKNAEFSPLNAEFPSQNYKFSPTNAKIQATQAKASL